MCIEEERSESRPAITLITGDLRGAMQLRLQEAARSCTLQPGSSLGLNINRNKSDSSKVVSSKVVKESVSCIGHVKGYRLIDRREP